MKIKRLMANKMKGIWYCIFITVLIQIDVRGQNRQMDTLAFMMSAKHKMLSTLDNQVRDIKFYTDFLTYTPKYTKLNSKGFDDIVFFDVIAEFYSDENKIISKDSHIVIYRSYFDQVITPISFVFGYNLVNHEIYTIAIGGKLQNDVTVVARYIRMSDSIKRRCLNEKMRFFDCFYIEGIDTEKLFEKFRLALK